MQIHKKQLVRQQAVLQHLGYYKGKLDGIWSNETIVAKRAFEFSPDFEPGIPSNGLPFASKGPYPKGITQTQSMLSHKDITEDKMLSLVVAKLREDVVDMSVETTTTPNVTSDETATPEDTSEDTVNRTKKYKHKKSR